MKMTNILIMQKNQSKYIDTTQYRHMETKLCNIVTLNNENTWTLCSADRHYHYYAQ